MDLILLVATVAAVARKTVISYPSRSCCSLQERRKSGNEQARVMAKRREELKATPNLPLNVIAIALPAPDRATANTRVSTSAPHAANTSPPYRNTLLSTPGKQTCGSKGGNCKGLRLDTSTGKGKKNPWKG